MNEKSFYGDQWHWMPFEVAELAAEVLAVFSWMQSYSIATAGFRR